jgi:AraC-like DNA-binding protein
MLNCRDEAPSPLLRPYVENFWYAEPTNDATCEVLPDASVDVCFAFSERKPEILLFGPTTARTVYEFQPGIAYLGIKFRPGAAALLLHEDMSCLTDAAIAVPAFLGMRAERIMDLNDGIARSNYLEAAIVRALAGYVGRSSELVSNAIELIHRTQCNIRIQELADECGVSRRHLERVFSECVGVSPKIYTRIYRFRAVMDDAAAKTPVNWADIAAAHGYSDQSHFIRDYRSFSGRVPTAQ